VLIVTIPKSAGTSLLDTLGRLHPQIPARQTFDASRPVPDRFAMIARYHSDVREYDAARIADFCAADRLFKQHIPPTPGNLGLLRGRPVVVLLRDVAAVVEAYRRADERGIHTARPEFRGVVGTAGWAARAAEIGLTAQLRDFDTGWRTAADASAQILCVQTADLLADPTAVVRRIEAHLGLPVSRGPVELSRKRYSRDRRPRLARRLLSRLGLR
jgi:hypothetical protein